jgi:hypothetical protein
MRLDLARSTCVHHCGLMYGVCRAGVAYESVADTAGDRPRYPCFSDHDARTTCDKRRLRTPEEIAAYEASVARMLAGIEQGERERYLAAGGTPEGWRRLKRKERNR